MIKRLSVLDLVQESLSTCKRVNKKLERNDIRKCKESLEKPTMLTAKYENSVLVGYK
jgi:hypothetical protein